MSLQKRFIKSKKSCRVTFSYPEPAANGAKSVKVIGGFNNWEKETGIPMGLKKGNFSAVVDLQPQQEHEFRYLLDNERWENDHAADKYVTTPYGVENSVVIIGKAEIKA